MSQHQLNMSEGMFIANLPNLPLWGKQIPPVQSEEFHTSGQRQAQNPESQLNSVYEMKFDLEFKLKSDFIQHACNRTKLALEEFTQAFFSGSWDTLSSLSIPQSLPKLCSDIANEMLSVRQSFTQTAKQLSDEQIPKSFTLAIKAVPPVARKQQALKDYDSQFDEANKKFVETVNNKIASFNQALANEFLAAKKEFSNSLNQAFIDDCLKSLFAKKYQDSYSFNIWDSEFVIVSSTEDGFDDFQPISFVMRKLALELSHRKAKMKAIDQNCQAMNKRLNNLQLRATENAAANIVDVSSTNVPSTTLVSQVVQALMDQGIINKRPKHPSRSKNDSNPGTPRGRRESRDTYRQSLTAKSPAPGQSKKRFASNASKPRNRSRSRGERQSPRRTAGQHMRRSQSPGASPSPLRLFSDERSRGQIKSPNFGILKRTPPRPFSAKLSHVQKHGSPSHKKRKKSTSPAGRSPNNARSPVPNQWSRQSRGGYAGRRGGRGGFGAERFRK